MKKRRTKNNDPRAETQPGHYLKNAPWRQDFVEEFNSPSFSARDTMVLALLFGGFLIVAAVLWMNPPKLLTFKPDVAVKAQATLAGHRSPHAFNGLQYDPSKFEEVKEDDPMVDDDLDDVLNDEPSATPTRSL